MGVYIDYKGFEVCAAQAQSTVDRQARKYKINFIYTEVIDYD